MCGRVRLDNDYSEIKIRLKFAPDAPAPNYEADYNKPPTMPMLVAMRSVDGRRIPQMMKWGLIPHWAKDSKLQYSTFNARSEEFTTKPAFKDAWKWGQRCLVLTNGFYEWKKLDAKTKQPYAIVMKDRSLYGFAGLWERWKDKASGEVVRSFTIITTEPNEVCAPIHDRMPVIVDPANYGKWLGEEPVDPMRLLMMLNPFPAEQMECYPVGTAVGNVKNDEPGLLEPVAA